MVSDEELNYRNLEAKARQDAERAADPFDKRTLSMVARQYAVLAERARIRTSRGQGGDRLALRLSLPGTSAG